MDIQAGELCLFMDYWTGVCTFQVFWSWTSPRQGWTASRPTTWSSLSPAWLGGTVWSCCRSTSLGRTSSSYSTSSSCCRRVRPSTVAPLVTWCLTSPPSDTPAPDTATLLTSTVRVCRKLSKQHEEAFNSGAPNRLWQLLSHLNSLASRTFSTKKSDTNAQKCVKILSD